MFESSGGVLRTTNAHHLIVAGGYISNSGLTATTAVYSLRVTNAYPKWIQRKPMPRALTHCAQALVNHTMYLCGGFLGKAPGRSVPDCYSYSILSDTWNALPNLPIDVGGGSMVYIKPINSLFYGGGMRRKEGRYDGIDMPNTYMLSLDNIKAGWKRKANMPNPRNHMAAATVSSRHFFLGGQHSDDEDAGNQATVNEYVYQTNKWFTKAPLPLPLGHIVGSTFAYWNGILTVGGVRNGRKQISNIYYYRVDSNSWTLVGHYPRSVQSPICGLSNLSIHCTTGMGKPGWAAQSFHRKMSVPAPV